jgi:hypothetical protein
VDVDEHPWRALPIAMVAIAMFAAAFIVVSFVLSQALTGTLPY